MKNNVIARKFWNKRPLIAVLLFIFSLIISSGWQPTTPVHASSVVTLITSSLAQQVIPHTSSGSTHVFSNYVVPAGAQRLLVVAAATSFETEIWEKATYGSTEMTYVTAHHDTFATGVSIWILPLGTSTTAEAAQDITLSHFSGNTLATDAEFVSVAVFENVDPNDPYSPTVSEPPAPGPRRFGIFSYGPDWDPPQTSTNSILTVPSDAGDMIFDIYVAYNTAGSGVNAPTNNPGTGQTVRHTATATSDDSGCALCYHAEVRWSTSTKPGTAGTDTVRFGDDGEYWVHGAVNFNQHNNVAPTITSNNTASVEENQTSAIDVASDDDAEVEGGGLTYSLSGGVDANLFNIDTDYGIVTFKSAPDYEMPGDDDQLNDYEVQVTVTDSGALTAVQDIVITVTDVFECNGVPTTASNETELNQVIGCYNLVTNGDYTVDITQDITLTAATTAVNNATAATLQLNGNGSFISGADSYRLFEIQAGDVTLTNITLQNGLAAPLTCMNNPFACGGAIFVGASGDVTLTEVTVKDSQAAEGGGIAVDGGVLTVASSTLSGNSVTGTGSAILGASANVTIGNSTLSGNSGTAAYRGFFSSTNIRNSTIASNASSGTSGLSLFAGSTTLRNSIVANNTGGNNCSFSTFIGGGSFSANNTNLADDGSCGNAVQSVSINLGSLQNNGGTTMTHALLDGSAAIDAGSASVCLNAPINNVDQRGVARPQGTSCDVGAFERRTAVSSTLFVNSTPALDWTPAQASCIHTLWYSTEPYGTYVEYNGDPTTFDVATPMGDSSTNYFWYTHIDCTDDTAESNTLGEFTFDIVAGS